MPGKTSTAFTLIELLVVVAILGILAAVLFPVFARARENARRASCQSNMKSIVLSFKQYNQDYDDHYPPHDIGDDFPNYIQTWGGLTVTNWVVALQPYARSIQIFQCPSDVPHKGTDYYYNTTVSGKIDSDFKYSANTVLLCEGMDESQCNFAVAVNPVTSGIPPAYARHLSGSNYAFVDGHIKWLQSSQAPAGDTVPASQGGFTFGS